MTIVLPMVERFNDHPALGIWEIINEIEWIEGVNGITKEDMQKFTGKIAAAIHRTKADTLITVGNAHIEDLVNCYWLLY